MRVLHGAYEMAIGYHEGRPGEGQRHPGQAPSPPPYAALLTLTKGSSYEMIRPGSWHSVRPCAQQRWETEASNFRAFTVMVTGSRWDGVWSPKAPHKLGPITPEAKLNIFAAFRSFYGRND